MVVGSTDIPLNNVRPGNTVTAGEEVATDANDPLSSTMTDVSLYTLWRLVINWFVNLFEHYLIYSLVKVRVKIAIKKGGAG